MCQFVYGGGDVSLLHSTLLQLLHRAHELKGGERGRQPVRNCPETSPDRTDSLDIWEPVSLPLCHHPGDACWSRSPDSEREKQQTNESKVSRIKVYFELKTSINLDSSPSLLTFSFCASPRTLSSSVMESTNPWK